MRSRGPDNLQRRPDTLTPCLPDAARVHKVRATMRPKNRGNPNEGLPDQVDQVRYVIRKRSALGLGVSCNP